MTRIPEVKKSLTRRDLSQQLAERCWLHPVMAYKVVDLFCHQITTALTHDKTVTLRRFGTFKPKVRSAYTVRHPKREGQVHVSAKKLTSFKASKIFLKTLS